MWWFCFVVWIFSERMGREMWDLWEHDQERKVWEKEMEEYTAFYRKRCEEWGD